MSLFSFRFQKRRLDDGTYVKESKIPVTFSANGNTFPPTMATIDSGSGVCFLPLEIAEILGFNKNTAAPSNADGIGGTEPTGSFNVDVKIERPHSTKVMRNVPIFVFLNPDTKFVILGLYPLFEKFDIIFKVEQDRILLKENI